MHKKSAPPKKGANIDTNLRISVLELTMLVVLEHETSIHHLFYLCPVTYHDAVTDWINDTPLVSCGIHEVHRTDCPWTCCHLGSTVQCFPIILLDEVHLHKRSTRQSLNTCPHDTTNSYWESAEKLRTPRRKRGRISLTHPDVGLHLNRRNRWGQRRNRRSGWARRATSTDDDCDKKETDDREQTLSHDCLLSRLEVWPQGI